MSKTMKNNRRWPYETSGIDDTLFVRGDVPMTKSEVRAVTISKLKLSAGMRLLDIGAGTGSISVESGLKGCIVTAIERNKAGVALIGENSKIFSLKDLHVIEGKAPMDLPKNGQFDRVFLGGTGGKAEGIFKYLESHLKPGGVIVANTITIENTSKFMSVMQHYKYEHIEAVQVNVSRSKAVGNVHMMLAENPITVISAIKAKEGKNNG